jgi:hypothetical protein
VKPELVTVKLSDVIFDEELYPRKSHDPVLVQRYTDTIDEIETLSNFIALSSDNHLLDGKHRWLAYRKLHENNGDPVISAYRYPVEGWLECFRLACELNAAHGWQLNESDKEADAKRFYHYGVTSYEDIAKWLHVGKAKISSWLSRTVKEERDRRNEKIQELWLACHTQEEIAESCECGQATVNEQIEKFIGLVSENQTDKARAEHANDFDAPLYNIWKQQEKTSSVNHRGNSEVRWVDNLLYLYTQPFDVIIDPFAGGGSTIDICKKRFRRYWASDRKPIIEREKEIRQWDVTDGLPPIHRWQDVKLVYLDPPYWKQAEGFYSDDPTDLANMELDEFHKILTELVYGFAKKLSHGAMIALLMQPTQWKALDRSYTDHIASLFKSVDLPLDMRFSCPYESQQSNAQMVEWAKTNRKCLVLTRELIVWRIA